MNLRTFLVSPKRRERKNTRFLLQTTRRQARNTVSWPKSFGGKLETLFLDPITRREGFAARFLSLPNGGKVSRHDSSLTRSRGKENHAILASRGAAGRNCRTILVPRGAAGRNCRTILVPRGAAGRNCRTILVPRGAAGSWRQRTILSHGNSWHVFGGKMTGRASKRSNGFQRDLISALSALVLT